MGVILVSSCVFGLCYAYLNRSTIKIDFNPDTEYQTFKYFGASSCWNNRIIGRDESEETKAQLTELLYGDSGLKLSIFRYNIGAGSIELENTGYSEAQKTISFFKSENYENKDSFLDVNNYDITKDSDYLSMLKLALETNNVKKVVAFCNSPHFLLTKNTQTDADHAHENNLLEENFEVFSHYAIICTSLLDNYVKSLGYNDIEIYISPVNEPQWKWDGVASTQEGCHFDADHLAKFYDVFYKVLKEYNNKNNTNYKLDMFESGNYKLGLASSKNKTYFKEFSKYSYFEEVDEISMHSYAADTDKSIRRKFYNYFKKFNKDFVMSEYCVMEFGVDESVSMGLKSAKVLMQDLNILNTVEWSWWLGIAGGGFEDGLVYFNSETKDINRYYRYYMFAQFMRYIDYGDVRIKADIYDLMDLGGVDSVGFKKPDGSVVVIILNDSKKEKNILISSDKFSTAHIVETYENNYLKESDKTFNGKFKIKANSVTTIILK